MFITTKKYSVLLAMAAVMSFAAMGCSDGDITGTANPNLVVEPSPVIFAGGQYDHNTFEIRNDGDDTLRLSDIELTNDDPDAPFAKDESFREWPTSIDIDPTDSIVLAVEYDPPEGEVEHSGSVSMSHNDNDIEGDKVIGLETDAADADLFVNPSPVNFQQTPAGSSDWQVVEIQNIGSGTIDVDDVSITEGDNYYSVSFFDDRNSDGTVPSSEDDVDAPVTTSLTADGGDVLFARVLFEPDTEDPITGTMTVNYDGTESKTVDLIGNSGDACLEVSDEDGLDFGPAALNDTTFQTMTLRNCSPEADLTISDLSISDDGGGVYSIDDADLPGSLPDSNLELSPGETTTTLVGFTPTEETSYSGELTISSDDSQRPQLDIPISGEGVDADCPVAEIAGSLPGGAPSNPLGAGNQDIVELSSDGSHDPDGTDLSYEWAVISRPAGSQAEIEPSHTDPNPEFEVDIVGHFQIELIVYDEYGLANCEPAILEIDATPTGDIHVQLVWSAPQVDEQGGPDPAAGFGTDLDIHYVHQDTMWGETDSVYWRYPSHDWGAHGEADLDIDDLYGSDPENINHSDPMDGGFYRVGVHYYCDNNYGPADATVRIYFDDSLEFEETERMEATDHFWHTAVIQWDAMDPGIDFVDDYSESISDLSSCGNTGF